MTDTVNVPREPTEAMIRSAVCEYLPPSQTPEDIAVAIYRAMIAAAPKSEPVRWTEDMERESRESEYERGFRDGKLSHPEAQKGEPVTKRTMTVSLSDAEMEALEELIAKKDLDGPNVFRQALKLYQAVDRGAASVSWGANTHPAPSSDELLAEWAELQRLAEAASPGPWKACATIYKHMNCEIRTGAKGEGQPIGQIWDGPNAFADGQFIAAASPQAVLKLIAITKHKGPQ